MSNFIPHENKETEDWLARQSEFQPGKRPQGDKDYAADVVQRGGTGFSSSVGHPEHLADFRRFALNGHSLYVPRFDVYVAHVDDLATRYTQVIPKIEKDGAELLHAMYINKDPIKVGAKGVKNIYLCLEGYNESEAQFIDNQLNRNGVPWFIVEEAYLVYEEGDMPDEHGVVGQEGVKKYVKVGTFNTKTQFCETYIGQEMYLHYHAPKPPGDAPYDGSEVTMTNWWQPTFDWNTNKISIGVGLNFVASDVKTVNFELPEYQFKPEYTAAFSNEVDLVADTTHYIYVKYVMTVNNYIVADHIYQDDEEVAYGESGSSITWGDIKQYYFRSQNSNAASGPGSITAPAHYSIVTVNDSAVPPNDDSTGKHQLLGIVTCGAGPSMDTWFWRLNHAFYWNDLMTFCAGSLGFTAPDTAADGESAAFDRPTSHP